jgi:hypothetical protein
MRREAVLYLRQQVWYILIASCCENFNPKTQNIPSTQLINAMSFV